MSAYDWWTAPARTMYSLTPRVDIVTTHCFDCRRTTDQEVEPDRHHYLIDRTLIGIRCLVCGNLGWPAWQRETALEYRQASA